MASFRLLSVVCALLAVLPALVPASAQSRPSGYRLCVENINYYPHYDFSKLPGRGYAADLFALFSATTGIELELVALPVKRLRDHPDCQLVYPDNARWHASKDPQDNDTATRHFSQPLVEILGATLVRRGEGQRPLTSLSAIAVPRGFTPDHLLAVQSQHPFKLVETPDAATALKMLLKKRVDAVDVEWHVARQLLVELGAPDSVELGQQLPLVSVGFALSAADQHPVLLAFDRFLQQHAQAVQQLKARYDLMAVTEQCKNQRCQRLLRQQGAKR